MWCLLYNAELFRLRFYWEVKVHTHVLIICLLLVTERCPNPGMYAFLLVTMTIARKDVNINMKLVAFGTAG